jgi:uncharacterized protein YecT (DUF1311 family)
MTDAIAGADAGQRFRKRRTVFCVRMSRLRGHPEGIARIFAAYESLGDRYARIRAVLCCLALSSGAAASSPAESILRACLPTPACDTPIGAVFCAQSCMEAAEARIAGLMDRAGTMEDAPAPVVFTQAMTAWRAYREAHCALFGAGGGSEAPATSAICRLRETLRQEAALAAILAETGQR